MNSIRNGFRTACRGKAPALASAAAAAAPGVTVYGTADVGASRSPR